MQWRTVNRWRSFGIGIAGLVIALCPSGAWACAVCWGGDDALARGLSASVMFLMSMPFIVGGSMIGVLYIAHQRARGERWPYVPIRKLTRLRKEERP
jgi:drug/metabolite transporter (DMT)-like permease